MTGDKVIWEKAFCKKHTYIYILNYSYISLFDPLILLISADRARFMDTLYNLTDGMMDVLKIVL